MCLGKNKENDTFNFGNISLKNSKEEIVLGLTIDNKHSFDNHAKKICRKASQKLVYYQEYQIIQIQNKKKFFLWNDKIKAQLLPTYLDVLLKKIKQLNQ